MPTNQRNHTTKTTWSRIRDAYGPGYQANVNFDRTLNNVAQQQGFPR